MWLDFAIALSCGGGGLVCGWIMHAIGGFGHHALVKHAAARIKHHSEPSHERVTEVADRLKDYVSSMAADVDAHQTRVQAVNNTLIEGNDQSPEVVFQAVTQLIEANQTMQSQLHQAQDRIHEQAVQIESAERRAETDALTRVPNRRAFDNHIHQRHSLGSGKAGTLALLDVDHFKKFNDVYGHRAGDEVLRIVANVLHARLQSYGLVSRFGGEEFAVILDGCPVQEAKDLIEEVRIAIGAREIQFEDKRLRVTASAGVAELGHGESVDEWLQRADDGMYRSKEEGRDCGHWMDDKNPIRITSDSQTSEESQDSGGQSNSPDVHQAGDEAGESSASQTSKPATQADPTAFAYLPDQKTLGETFLEIRGRTQSSVSVFIMAIKCNVGAGNAAMRSLLQIVRATMRTVDRVGCGDDTTLLICMPSMDEGTAYERGRQIHRSAEAIGLGPNDSGEHQLGIGVVEAALEEEFADAVSRAIELSQACPEQGVSPVSIEGQRAPA